VTGVAEQRFSDHHEQLLITLATHGAIALENAKLFRAAAQTARHAGILAATARTLALNASPEQLYAGLARLVTESLRADGFSIHAADAAYDQVTLLRSHGLEAATPNAAIGTFWDTPAGGVIRSATPAFITNAAGIGFRDEFTGASTVPETTGHGDPPLIIEGRVGVCSAALPPAADFDDRERALLIPTSHSRRGGDDAQRARRRPRAAARHALSVAEGAARDIAHRACATSHAEIHRAVASIGVASLVLPLLLAGPGQTVVPPALVVVDGLSVVGGAITGAVTVRPRSRSAPGSPSSRTSRRARGERSSRGRRRRRRLRA
jgi:hypothetical protein